MALLRGMRPVILCPKTSALFYVQTLEQNVK